MTKLESSKQIRMSKLEVRKGRRAWQPEDVRGELALNQDLCALPVSNFFIRASSLIRGFELRHSSFHPWLNPDTLAPSLSATGATGA
jgi:hypothetical protein